MDRLIELGQLFDYYGMFLTERQRALVDAYANENLSLGELAEQEGITRQGVRDTIVRAEHQLREMEEKLGMIRRYGRLQAVLQRMEAELPSIKEERVKTVLREQIDSVLSTMSTDDFNAMMAEATAVQPIGE